MMRIDFERSGGFAGMTISSSVDTDKLSASEAGDLTQIVKSAQFFSLPERINGGPGADQFNYKITVQSDTLSRTVQTTDSAMPPNLKPLVDRMMALARSGQRAQ